VITTLRDVLAILALALFLYEKAEARLYSGGWLA
jgi:hypothetical protein